MIVDTELYVCTVCIHLLANGEYDDGTSAGAIAGAGMAATWGDEVRNIVPGGEEELGFMNCPCDTCGDTAAGDRFTAALLRNA